MCFDSKDGVAAVTAPYTACSAHSQVTCRAATVKGTGRLASRVCCSTRWHLWGWSGGVCSWWRHESHHGSKLAIHVGRWSWRDRSVRMLVWLLTLHGLRARGARRARLRHPCLGGWEALGARHAALGLPQLWLMRWSWELHGSRRWLRGHR